MTMTIDVTADPITVSLTVTSVSAVASGSVVSVAVTDEQIDVTATNTLANVTCESSDSVVVSANPTVTVISAAEQGPPGASAVSQATEIVEAGQTMSALKPVAIVDGVGYVASNTTPGHRGFGAGISISSASSGNSFTVQTFGRIQDASWNWDTSMPWVFFGNGVLTQTPPTSGWLQSVARVESSDTIFVQLGELIERV